MLELSASRRHFKLFGLQRTATNLMKCGLVANYQVKSSERGREWKHGRIKRSAKDGLDIVVCTRHPLAWLDAMFRFSKRSNDYDGCEHFDKDWSFPTFCTSPHYKWQVPLLRWNEMNRHYYDWVTANPKQGILVRSEDLLGTHEQAEQFTRVGSHFGWERKDTIVHTYRRAVRHAGPTLGSPMNWDYYKNEEYMNVYPDELLDCLTTQIDRELAVRLSYAIPTG
ncbi:MAG: hypothetical protein P4L99_05850 [Chthoniobacter sp.]|nr:hypothetical protein [Chthoniobacter sp.]